MEKLVLDLQSKNQTLLINNELQGKGGGVFLQPFPSSSPKGKFLEDLFEFLEAVEPILKNENKVSMTNDVSTS
jgi:hypothetical protein